MFLNRLIILFIIWFVFWSIYNFIFLKNGKTTENSPQLLVPIYIIFSFVVFWHVNFLPISVTLLFLFVSALGTILRSRNVGRLANSLFQMAWFNSVALLQIGSPGVLALVFFAAHIPVVFLTHLTKPGVLLIICLSGLGGYILALLLLHLPQPAAYFTVVITHYITYSLIRPIDIKYNLGIIN